MPRAPASPPAPRVRRDPDAARALILDAAERVFADRGPDAAGLKDVARAAGVSHALVSHYFGSFEALVEATLARRVARLRGDLLDDIVATGDGNADAILDRVAALAEDRVTIRLAGWAFLTGRAQREDFFSAKQRGLRTVVDVIAAKRGASTEHAAEAREDVEIAVVSALTLILGFGLAKDAVLSGLGYAPGSAAAARFEAKYRARVKEIVVGQARRK
jgi:AcrR family transcriptional regulator